MTQTYFVSGMTCGNCVGKVKNELLKMGDVLQAEVRLSSPQATIMMQKHIPVSILQHAISKAGSFIISEIPGHPDLDTNEDEKNASWRPYWPLLLVFFFITGIATIASFQAVEFDWMSWMNNFMGGFFIAFSFFKFLDLKGFAESYATYDLLASRWRNYGFVYPFMELALGIAYVAGFNPVLTNIATIIIMSFSSLGVIHAILSKRKIQCACLGTVFNLPMSTVTVIEDLLMVAMALLTLIIIL